VIVGADSDPWAMETHAANLPGLTWTGDLTDPQHFLQSFEVWGIADVDLHAGGVPCQPFSRAGRPRIANLVERGVRGAHDARAELWESFISIARVLRPKAVLVENVPDLPRWNDGAVLIGFYESLRELGYSVEARILDGFRFGVPQHRQRLILLAFAEGRRPVWPEPTDECVRLGEAIDDLPIVPSAQRAEELPYAKGAASNDFQREMRAGLAGEAAEVVWDHITRDVRPDDLEAFRLLK
jgi:DNA (cytosine-5)-methyltransferase 1